MLEACPHTHTQTIAQCLPMLSEPHTLMSVKRLGLNQHLFIS